MEYHPVTNPDGKYKAAQLVRACWALRDMCLAYDLPLLSGKDSMYVDGLLPGAFGEMHRVSGLPTLFFTAVSVLDDLRLALTLDLKTPGDLIYLLGETKPELGGSEFYELLGYVGLSVPQVRPQEFLSYYRLVEEAIKGALLSSCHGVYRGGLLVHLALISLASGLGLDADLSRIAPGLPVHAALYAESAGRFLISTPPGHRQKLEDLLQGQPLYFLGEVRPDGKFHLRREGQTLIKAPVNKLQQTWQRRFGNLI